MPQRFADKLDLVIKALSATRGHLASDLGVDKSIVGRWLTGAVTPSPHNLSKITSWVAARVGGFTTLDWDRSMEGLAEMLGVAPDIAAPDEPSPPLAGLQIPLMPEILQATARRGRAYEGYFKSTRPYASRPGAFIHDYIMLRLDEHGLLRLIMGSGGVFVEGWALLLQNQVFVIASELTSGSMGFGIFNGVNTLRAGLIDGVLLNCALDSGRTPTASLMIIERIGDLSGDREADDQSFAELARGETLGTEHTVPDDIRQHLARDVGPAQLALGGDWLLRLPLARSLARGMIP